jgi:hypothetical protein
MLYEKSGLYLNLRNEIKRRNGRDKEGERSSKGYTYNDKVCREINHCNNGRDSHRSGVLLSFVCHVCENFILSRACLSQGRERSSISNNHFLIGEG